MITTTKISYQKQMEDCDIFWEYIAGKPTVKNVFINGKNVTDLIGPMSRAKIKIAVFEAAREREEGLEQYGPLMTVTTLNE